MRLAFFFQNARKTLLDIFFPPLCVPCRAYLTNEERPLGICSSCLRQLPIHNAFFCGACSSRLPYYEKHCHPYTPYVLAAAVQYDHAKELIHLLKYEGVRAAALPLATIVLTYIDQLRYDFSNFLLLPIPLHPSREHERGFNQSTLIGRLVARALGISLVEDVLIRTRATAPQTLSKNSRQTNIAGCFAVVDPSLVLGRDILLLDDVSTTGSTLAEAARVLRAAGARRVIGLVVAKAR